MSIRSQNKHVNLQTQIQDLSLSYKFLGCQFILEIPSFLIEIVFTDYKIHRFKPCNLVGFFFFFVCAIITNKSRSVFTPNRNPIFVSHHSLSHLPQFQSTTNLLPASTYLFCLDISFRQNHTLGSLLCPASLT